MLTLWDLLDPLLTRLKSPPSLAPRRQQVVEPRPPVALAPMQIISAPVTEQFVGIRPVKPATARQSKRRRQESTSGPSSMQEKYDTVARRMLEIHGIRVRKWRKNMSGIAWYVTYQDGRRVNLIESPRPLGPMSVAIFLHEVGHHAIGFNVYKPRCLEEYHAWRWSLEAMEANGLNITDAVRLRMHRSLWYAVEKAKRRGIKQIPHELTPFLEKPSFARRRRR